ncbi:TPA_asm: hypothetical protein HUJ06_000018 [Nelumbo nucifera]|uniref:Uncharacterized protein n=1 Tax=Nelumbo nucifera TaxID=4432 RepID=A0A823A1C5_NELNU|nr:TPA_asm: hypothetical protein HUJ06_000018 [Nelumbo nucifera]
MLPVGVDGESRSATRLGERTDADCGGAPSPGCCVMPVETSSSNRGRQHAPLGVPWHLRARASACGHPIRPVLNTDQGVDMRASQRVSKTRKAQGS